MTLHHEISLTVSHCYLLVCFQLTGNIPSELGLMTSMTELHLYSNRYVDLVPALHFVSFHSHPSTYCFSLCVITLVATVFFVLQFVRACPK